VHDPSGQALWFMGQWRMHGGGSVGAPGTEIRVSKQNMERKQHIRKHPQGGRNTKGGVQAVLHLTPKAFTSGA